MQEIDFQNTDWPEELREKALKNKPVYQNMIKQIKKLNHREIDDLFHQLHYEEMDAINCLDCANCCKSLSPAIYDRDIERASRYLKIKVSEFIEKYLIQDGDREYSFKESPCPFLDADNFCIIYNARPKACREYPHTDRKRMFQILNLCLKNTETCPVVFNIFEKIRNA